MQTHTTALFIIHPTDIAFTVLSDNVIAPFYCEASFTGEFQFDQVQPERYRSQQTYLYALTKSNDEIIVYSYKYSGSVNDSNNCYLAARIGIPEDFRNGGPIGFTSIRGSLVLTNTEGKLLLIETSTESLLQQAKTYLFEPYSFRELDSAKQVDDPIKIITAKAPDRNIYLSKQGDRTTGSYITMRVPGSKT